MELTEFLPFYFCQNKCIKQQYYCVLAIWLCCGNIWHEAESKKSLWLIVFFFQSMDISILNVISNLEGYFSGKRVSMINNWHAIISIPAVQLDAPTALQQHLVKNYIQWSCHDHAK